MQKLRDIYRRDLNPMPRKKGENKVSSGGGGGCSLISLQVHTCVTNQRYFELRSAAFCDLYSLSGALHGAPGKKLRRPEKFHDGGVS